jgi:hypothetical protein
MSAWLIFIALVSIASMPTAFRMARTRGRSTYVWLEARARAWGGIVVSLHARTGRHGMTSK